MPVSQPPIERDQPVRSSWSLEVADTINRLEQRIEELEQRIQDLEED